MDKFTEGIIKKIEEKNIKPKSRAYFIIKRILDIGVFLSILILSSLLFSMVFHYMEESDFELNAKLNNSILFLIPFFWIALFIIILVVGFIYFYYKLNGYRNNIALSIFLTLIASVLIGFCINFCSRFNYDIDDFLSVNMPMYYQTIPQDDIWREPERGYLFGRLKSIEIINNLTVLKLVDDINKSTFTAEFVNDNNGYGVYKCAFRINDRYKFITDSSYGGYGGDTYNIIKAIPWHLDDCR